MLYFGAFREWRVVGMKFIRTGRNEFINIEQITNVFWRKETEEWIVNLASNTSWSFEEDEQGFKDLCKELGIKIEEIRK